MDGSASPLEITGGEGAGAAEAAEGRQGEEKPVRLPDAELRRCLWTINVSWGVFGAAWMSIVMGAPFPAFARQLGAGTFAFGALSSLRFLAVAAQIPGAYWLEKTRNRKRLFFMMHLPARLTWLVIAFLPWLVPQHFARYRVAAFMFLLLSFSLMDAVGSISWMPWVADIIPDRVRARFLSQRQRISTFTSLIAAALAGWLLDRQPAGAMYMYTILFAVAAILGAIDVGMYWRIPNMPLPRPALRLGEMLRRPLRDRRFRRYLVYSASNTVSGSVMGTFIWLYALETLKLTKFESNLYLIIIGAIATILTTRYTGALADRFGNRPVLMIAWVGLIVTPLMWVMAGPHSYGLLVSATIIGGVCGGATMLLGMNLTFAMTPRPARSAYVAINSLASGLAGFVAPLVAGALAEKFSDVQIAFFAWRFGNLHLLMIGVAVYRLFHTIILVPRLPEARQISTRAMLQKLLAEARARKK